jgi:hypothetical protein
MPSARFRVLSKREAELRRHLLPRAFSPTGTYSSRAHDRTRGYQLLVHAEIEAFVEERVLEVANRARLAWTTNALPPRSLVALIAFDEPAREAPTSLLHPPQRRSPTLRERIERSATTFSTKVRMQNNGIRESNLLTLLMPIGVQEHDIDRTWLAMMDSWGAERGRVAHTTITVQNQPDPKDERDKVLILLDGLRRIDALLDSI